MTSNLVVKKPLKFHPILKEKIWGGQNLASVLNKDIPGKKIGESWELSALKPDVSRHTESFTLLDLIKADAAGVLGDRLSISEFPLLYKFIDAHENLSVQVHPDDEVQNGIVVKGKTECWYIVDAIPDAKIIVGFKKDVNSEIISNAVKNDTLSDYLDMIPIKRGDVLFIPAGTVHAIMGGTVIYELQESSDVTFRLYDWGRIDNSGKSRDLHIKESIEVLNFNSEGNYLIEPEIVAENGILSISLRAQCKYFNLEEWFIKAKNKIELPKKDVFTVLTLLDGGAVITCEDGPCSIKKGETVFIPACCQNNITIETEGKAQFLYSYVP